MATVRVGDTFPVRGVTREQVWAYLEDIGNAAEWNTFVKEATSDDPPGEGREIELRVGFLGITFPVRAVATESIEPRRSVIQGRKPFPSEIGMELVDAPHGIDLTGWFEMSPGKFFPVPTFVMKKAVQKQFEHDSRLLVARLEALT